MNISHSTPETLSSSLVCLPTPTQQTCIHMHTLYSTNTTQKHSSMRVAPENTMSGASAEGSEMRLYNQRQTKYSSQHEGNNL